MKQGLALLGAVLFSSAVASPCSQTPDPAPAPTAVAPAGEPEVEAPMEWEYAPRSIAPADEWSRVGGRWLPVSEDEAPRVAWRDGHAYVDRQIVWANLSRDSSPDLLEGQQRRVAIEVDWGDLDKPAVLSMLTGDAAEHVAGLTLPGVEDEDLGHVSGLTGLQRLDLGGSYVTDAGLANLSGMSELNVLQIGGGTYPPTISDAGMAHVARLGSLTELTLGDTAITGAGIEQLHGSALRTLRMNGNGWTQEYHCVYMTLPPGDGVIEQVSGLTQLRTLELRHNELTDADVAHIGRLTQLRHLDLSGNDITDVGATHLERLTRLRNLNLTDTKITQQGLRAFAGMSELRTLQVSAGGFVPAELPHLQELWLGGTLGRDTDAGLEHVGQLTRLRELHLAEPVSDADLAHLAPLTDLEILRIHAGELTYAGLEPLRGFENLRTLYVGGRVKGDHGNAAAIAGLHRLTSLELSMRDLRPVAGLTSLRWLNPIHPVDADGLRQLAALRELGKLTLAPEITNADLVHLGSLKRLGTLDLSNTQVTNAGLKHVAGLPALRELWLVDTGTEWSDRAEEQLDHIEEVHWKPPVYQWCDVERRGVCGGLGPWP